MKKVALIASSLTSGGAERNLLNLAISLPKDKYSTEIVSLSTLNDYNKEYAEKISNLKIIPVLLYKPPLSRLKHLLISPFALLKFIQIVHHNRYDVLIAGHEYNTFYLTVLCARLLRTKSVLIIVNNMRADLDSKNILLKSWHYALSRISFKLCTRIISISEELTKNSKSYFNIPKRKIDTILDGVMTDEIEKKIGKLDLNNLQKNENFTIVIYGRLVKKKGHEHLLRIIKFLNNSSNPKIKLLIIGKGPLEKKLKQLCSTLKINRYVYFKGFLAANPYLKLSKADLFIFTSLYEGFGNVIIEAMNCGLPIISVDCEFGPREILGASKKLKRPIKKIEYLKYGILTPSLFKSNLKQDPLNLSTEENLLASAILDMQKNSKLRKQYRKMSVIRAEKFTSQKMAYEYDKTIHKLL